MTDTIPRKQPIANKRGKPYYLYLLVFLILLILLWVGAMKVIDFANTHYIQKNRIVSMVWKWPIEIKTKEENKTIVKEVLPSYPGEIDTPVKEYICDKFGVYDCKIALGIVQAESGFNEEALNINSNSTIDLGIWQINSTHFKQPGCDMKAVLDPIRATDCAYNIYKASGNKWNAWVTFNNKSYLSEL